MYRENGQSFGLEAVGMLNLFPIIITHYFVLLILFNNFDAMFLLMLIGSVHWVWTVALIDDATPGSVYYKILYSETFRAPIFWLIIFAAVAMSVMPIYAWLKYR